MHDLIQNHSLPLSNCLVTQMDERLLVVTERPPVRLVYLVSATSVFVVCVHIYETVQKLHEHFHVKTSPVSTRESVPS